jgi:hypothetical protein
MYSNMQYSMFIDVAVQISEGKPVEKKFLQN